MYTLVLATDKLAHLMQSWWVKCLGNHLLHHTSHVPVPRIELKALRLADTWIIDARSEGETLKWSRRESALCVIPQYGRLVPCLGANRKYTWAYGHRHYAKWPLTNNIKSLLGFKSQMCQRAFYALICSVRQNASDIKQLLAVLQWHTCISKGAQLVAD